MKANTLYKIKNSRIFSLHKKTPAKINDGSLNLHNQI